MKANNTFRAAEPTWANACVGENGNPQIYEYAAGFASAAKSLLDSVIAEEGLELPVDMLIYPICFNMRHAVELFLKSTVASLGRVAAIRNRKLPPFDMVGTHDLGKVWTYVKEHAGALDVRYRDHVDGLEPYVQDIAELDATGQVFRYPFDTEQKKHLVDVSVINVLVLKQRFEELERRLQQLAKLNDDLVDEYRWGTFTSKLSRAQLVEVARQLPPRAKWREPAFDTTKAALRQAYGLSSTDFSRAICQIEKRHEMASLLGLVVAIPGLTDTLLETFFDEWVNLHGLEALRTPQEPKVVSSGEVSVRAMLDWREKRLASASALMATIQPRAFASLEALFYFDREHPLSEAFEAVLEDSLRDAASYNDPLRFRQAVEDLLVKTSALENVVNSLDFLGHGASGDLLLTRYGLLEVRERLLERSASRKRRVKLTSP